jgi:hypothetical protein
MKTVESSAVFQPKQWAEKASPEDNRKQDLTRTCALEHCSRCPEGLRITKSFDKGVSEPAGQGGTVTRAQIHGE